MSNSFFLNPSPTDLAHVPGSIREELVHDPQSHFREATYVSPPLSQMPSFLSIQPRSSLSNAPLSSGLIIDFNISSPDYLRNMVAALKIKNITGAAINFLSYLIFQRYEILDSSNNIITTIYDSNMLDRFLLWNDLETNRIAIAENFNPSNLGSISIAAGDTTEVNLYLPSFITSNVIRTDLVSTGITIRFYFSPLCSDNAAGLNVTSFNLLVWGQKYTSAQSSLDLNIKSSEILRYRFLNPVRGYLNNAYPLNPSSQYNIQITSGKGMNAFIVVKISDSVLTFNNTLKFYPVLNMQFNDKSNQIVGVNLTNRQWQSLVSSYRQFPGKILDYNVIQANSLSNIYIIPASINPLLSETNVIGLYCLTGFESIQFNTDSTLVSGNYKIEITCYNYSYTEIKDSVLTSVNSN
jgi:hypothetical protein